MARPRVASLFLVVLAVGLAVWSVLEPHALVFSPVSGSSPEAGAFSGDYVLAVSWQPAFCETRPKKPECASQTPTRFDARHFTLHGLWPEPRSKIYCGVDGALAQADREGNWEAVPELELSTATRAELKKIMPGTQSLLQRHEWIKHGTCTGGTPQSYYRLSLDLMAALNASGVQSLFAQNIGGKLNMRAIGSAFERAFGPGAGQRIRLVCVRDGDRELIGALRISLKDPLKGDLSSAIRRAAPVSEKGCPGGFVDAVGLQ